MISSLGSASGVAYRARGTPSHRVGVVAVAGGMADAEDHRDHRDLFPKVEVPSSSRSHLRDYYDRREPALHLRYPHPSSSPNDRWALYRSRRHTSFSCPRRDSVCGTPRDGSRQGGRRADLPEPSLTIPLVPPPPPPPGPLGPCPCPCGACPCGTWPCPPLGGGPRHEPRLTVPVRERRVSSNVEYGKVGGRKRTITKNREREREPSTSTSKPRST